MNLKIDFKFSLFLCFQVQMVNLPSLIELDSDSGTEMEGLCVKTRVWTREENRYRYRDDGSDTDLFIDFIHDRNKCG